jgi:Reverse transcriptase (RNA-dependent DNA polymerase)
MIRDSENYVYDEEVCRNTQITDNIHSWLEKRRGLTLLHLNIRSIRKHWDELCIVLDSQLGKFDILVLTEISLSEINNEFSLQGYNVYGKTRETKKGGGVLLYIKEDITFKIINCKFINFEGVSGVLRLRDNMEVQLIAVYRPPDKSKVNFVSELDMYLNNCKGKRVIYVGDININTMNEDDYCVQSYENVMAANGMYMCINGVTREECVLGNVTRSCIDHIYTSIRGLQIDSVIYQTKITDHYMIAVDVYNDNPAKTNGNNCKKFLKKYICEDTLKRTFREIDWTKSLQGNDCNEKYKNIVTTFTDCYAKSSYTREHENRKTVRKEWMSAELLEQIGKRDKLFQKWKNCRSTLRSTYMNDYKIIRNELSKKIKSTKIEYYKKKINSTKDSMKKTWGTINTIMGKKKRDTVDEVITRHLGNKAPMIEIVNAFAESFINDVDKIRHKCNIKTMDVETGTRKCDQAKQSMRMPLITKREVEEIITNLDVNKQPGKDGIRVKDLKNTCRGISQLIADLINQSVKSGIVPDELKVSIVRPIYKKGDHLMYSNYRQIHLLSIIEKILEIAVATHFKNYIDEFRIINALQFGFQKGKSTSDLLISFSEHINANLNDNMHTIALFVDFTKAFDTINHKILLEVLQNIGIRGPLLSWFKNYLSERKLIVKVAEEYSIPKEVNMGVPQGSNLGPLLYIIYVNYMFNIFENCQVYMFADDTVILTSHKDLDKAVSQMQKNFNQMHKWTHDNELIINSDKTKIMHICSPFNKDKHAAIDIIFHENSCLHSQGYQNCSDCKTKIKVVDNHVYLGITIDKHFTWRSHVNAICKRLRICAYNFHSLSQILPMNVTKIVYTALVDSIISYGILAWGNASIVHLQKIFLLQKKIIKNIVPCHIKHKLNFDTNLFFNALQILNIFDIYRYKIIIKYYYSTDYKLLYDHEIATRAQDEELYRVPRYKNKYGKRLLNNIVPTEFNKLPVHLKKLLKYSEIKYQIKNWLMADRQ